MGQPVKLNIKKGAVRKDRTALIFLQYCHNAYQRVLLSIEIAIPPQFWGKKTNVIVDALPEQYGKVANLQTELIAKLCKAEDMITHACNKGIPVRYNF
ncbi:MAG: hypothetical protein JST09_14195 [Bacteroidetes bacterium]|nr:hypothetical protein [Bacteroidota bacterium]